MQLTKRKMIHRLALALACAALFAPFPALSLTQAGTPRAILDRTSHDFGDVFAGEFLSCAFTVHNRGDADLQMSDRRLLAVLRPVAFAARPAAPV